MKKESNYKFLWGDYQQLWSIEANFLSFKNYKKISPWNDVRNIIEVMQNNRIRCYHSRIDLSNDVERGKLYLNEKQSNKFVEKINKTVLEQNIFFEYLRNTDVRKLSDIELYNIFIKARNRWSYCIGFFRATQQEGAHYLLSEIKKYINDEELSIVIQPSELDLINKEDIEWRRLVKQNYSKENLLDHASKYPFVAMCHDTYEDVIETLAERYKFDKKNINKKFDIIKEKNDLKIKQNKIINSNPEIKKYVKLAQRLALSRAEIKNCWAGTDFYLIPILNEISERTNESEHDINSYYLGGEIKSLFDGKKLNKKEKERRKNFSVGLWKNGKMIFKFGKEGECLAKKELGNLLILPKTKELKGVVASKGRAMGKVMILEANNVIQTREVRRKFKNGDILVTEMTQPNIVDIASKAGAIVTDEGGLLSHAAIISREFRIPCIVGTKIATELLKNGDKVEVDAYKGEVKILK